MTMTTTDARSTTTSPGTLDELVRALPAGAVVTDPDVMATYSRDREPWSPNGTPRPSSARRAVTTS